jgi:uncharacterized coiled-coil protein SlyX|tara:strand:- start:560 stop:763 length:204 start_codon:yes stop_codon:yes gene_type:complete
MDEQDYKNLITVYQNKYSDAINQNIALEARELKYRQTIEVLNQQITELENKVSKPKRTSKTTDDNTF